jgi:hypothetical protein
MSDKKGDGFRKLTGETKRNTLSHDWKEEDEEAIMGADGQKRHLGIRRNAEFVERGVEYH